ncbi:hypothetical protein Fcan01_02008 [Folsomia candida]|uniref:Uncharacterized protein n=1 Tax=Folsomia candida TaxID=158441 RepID=A0A226EZG4_FOLCA|nr:hypothetical protein Fcan01_02008 [Folsomia candida]
MAGLVGDGEYYDGSSEGTESDPTPIFHEIRSVSYSDKNTRTSATISLFAQVSFPHFLLSCEKPEAYFSFGVPRVQHLVLLLKYQNLQVSPLACFTRVQEALGHTSKETIPIVNFLEKAETHGETELVQGRSTARGASVNSINPKVFRILVSPSINVYAGERDIVTELLFINSFVNYL